MCLLLKFLSLGVACFEELEGFGILCHEHISDMACKARNEVGCVEAFCQHAIQEQHHLRHLVFQGIVDDIEIVVGIEHVRSSMTF